jgi:hypothetical protein
MVSLLQCIACHLAVSYPFTLSRSTLKAMAYEAPLISNPVAPAVNEFIEGEGVVLVPFNHHQALASEPLHFCRSRTNADDLANQQGASWLNAFHSP